MTIDRDTLFLSALVAMEEGLVGPQDLSPIGRMVYAIADEAIDPDDPLAELASDVALLRLVLEVEDVLGDDERRAQALDAARGQVQRLRQHLDRLRQARQQRRERRRARARR